MIPKIIHQKWNTLNLPPKLKEWQQSWFNHNPDWEYKLWTDEELEPWVLANYPQYLPFYRGLAWDIQRWDFIRYLWLSKLGGFYADTDVKCMKPLEPLCKSEIVLCTHHRNSTSICNAVMASIPGHYFWDAVISDIIINYETRMSTKNGRQWKVIATTGPGTVTDTYKRLPFKFDLHPYVTFYPFYVDGVKRKHVREKHYPDAYTKHFWSGSWR